MTEILEEKQKHLKHTLIRLDSFQILGSMF